MTATTTERLYPLFAAGRGTTHADRVALAGEVGVHRRTVDYHRKQWVAKGKPDPRAAGNEATETEPTPAPAPSAEEQTPVQDVQEPGSGPMDPEERQFERTPQVGEVYEGAVAKIDIYGRYVLVDILELTDPNTKRPVRGKVSVSEILRSGWCQHARDYLQEGDLVNVRILSLTRGTGRAYYRADLSIRRAPPHPRERIPLEEQPPITTRGDEVAAAIEEQAESRERPVTVTPPENGVGLCTTCAKRDVCMLSEFYSESINGLPDDRDYGRLREIRIRWGGRPVLECSAYQAREQAG